MKRYWKNNFFLMLLVLSSTLVNTSAYSQMERLSEVFGIEELGQFSSSDPSSVKEDDWDDQESDRGITKS